MEGIGYRLDISPQARDFLGTKGYDIQYGARPIKRAIQDYLEDELCELLINTDVPANSTLHADIAEEKIEISIQNS